MVNPKTKLHSSFMIELGIGEETMYGEPRQSIEKKVGLIHKVVLNVGTPGLQGIRMLAPYF